MSGRTYDAIIVGGGIVGAACALEFAKNSLRVLLIEASALGGGATAAGMGHIVAMDDSDAQLSLTRYSQQLWNELAPELPASGEYLSCGTLWVAADEEEMEEVCRKQRVYKSHGIPTEVLSPQSLHEAEPNLRPDLTGALRVPEDSVVYPPPITRFLAQKASELGADILLGRRVVKLDGRTAVLSDGTEVSGGLIVLANGCAVTEFVPAAAVHPRKGHLLITDRHPGFVRHQLVELGYLKSAHSVAGDSVAFNVQPRATGQLLLGSSRQYGVDHPMVEAAMMTRMLQRACRYMPALARLSAIRTWTGFRAATPDKLPLIGRWPEAQNLFLATGHEGLGITTSLGTAKILMDEVLGRPSAIAREPYYPARGFEHHA